MSCDKIYPERATSTTLLQRYRAYVRSIRIAGMSYVSLISGESKPKLTFYNFGPGLKLGQDWGRVYTPWRLTSGMESEEHHGHLDHEWTTAEHNARYTTHG